jgi:hypothetical protein
VAYFECHMWHIAWFFLVFFLLLEHYLEGYTPVNSLLTIFGVNHFHSCGALHLISTLHNHPWSWLPWDSHMWIAYLHLVDHLLFLDGCYGCLGGLFYCFISCAP